MAYCLQNTYWFRLSHILWENIPAYYGNLFPQNEGIFSQILGNTFPSSRESFPTICGTNTLYMETNKRNTWFYMMQCRLPAHYTMRNTLKHYENKVCFELKQEMFYEKCRFQEVFLIRHSPDNLIFIKKPWEYEKWKWKIVCR